MRPVLPMIILLLFASSAKAQASPEAPVKAPETKPAPTAAPAGLVATLSVAGGSEVVAGDPVVLELTIRNDGDEPAGFVMPAIGMYFTQTVRFQIRAPGSETFERVSNPNIYVGSYKTLVNGSYPARNLQPGESAEFQLPVGWDWSPGPADRQERSHEPPPRRWLFPEPGKYEVLAEVGHLAEPAPLNKNTSPPYRPSIERLAQAVWVPSAPTTLRVILPEMESDRAAFRDLVAMTHAWQVYAPWFAQRLRPEVAAFRERHGDSRYGRFAEMAACHDGFFQAWVTDRWEEALAAHESCMGMTERAERENWPPGWTAVAIEFEKRLKGFDGSVRQEAAAGEAASRPAGD